MNTTPPTWGTTALLALLGVLSGVLGGLFVLAALTLLLVTVAGVVMYGPPEVAGLALAAVQVIGAATMGALGVLLAASSGTAGLGSLAHGARHVGGPPAPTSGELRSLGAGPLAEGAPAGEV